ncbi:hypothetical protein GIB67_019685 [Kingdonia uniflora]|uniref:Elongation factor P n=1 Tax=Kingdonia uniflora TaxID=39325 RepID=A0A7J7MJT1_9MAGN|nr:hypothetical protein GIB67_019685 [Kingdonia uniflora]
MQSRPFIEEAENDDDEEEKDEDDEEVGDRLDAIEETLTKMMKLMQVMVDKVQPQQHQQRVELRDIDTGNKVIERFRTDEAIERVFVEEKTFTFLYVEGEFVLLMNPSTFEQIEVSKDLFGKTAAYLKEDMEVTMQFYDGKAMSASVPPRVTCTVAEAKSHVKGLSVAPQYKRVMLDNGLTVLAPPFVEIGDKIVINTTDDSYITRHLEVDPAYENS